MVTLLDLVKPTIEDSPKIVKILEKVGNTSYSVVDRRERQYIADAAESYLPGQSVVIKKGIIIGRTKSSQNYKEFNV